MALNGTLKKAGAGLSLLVVLVGTGAAIDSRYAKAADVERALKDVHQGLQNLQLGQLQATRALLARELFDYQVRNHRLTDLERQRAGALREEIDALDRRIEKLKHVQDVR